MRPQKILAILVLIAGLFSLGLPAAAATQPTGIQGGSVFVAREVEVRKISRPTLLKQESDPPVIFGKVTDSGGTEVNYTASSDQGPIEIKAHMGVTDLGGTRETTFRSDKEDQGGLKADIAYKGGTPPVRVEAIAGQGGEVLHVGSEETDQGGAKYAGKYVEGFTGPGQPKVAAESLEVDAKTLSAHPLRVQEQESSRQGAAHAEEMTRGAAVEQAKYEGMYG